MPGNLSERRSRYHFEWWTRRAAFDTAPPCPHGAICEQTIMTNAMESFGKHVERDADSAPNIGWGAKVILCDVSGMALLSHSLLFPAFGQMM